MATATLNDMQVLATDTVFGNRVLIALIQYCNTVANEAVSPTNPLILHNARKAFASSVINAPNQFKSLFIDVAASNQIVANEATANGSISGQVGAVLATSALLCTDTNISNAVAAAFNTFIPNV